MDIIDKIRPYFWKEQDYNFLWLYVVAIILICTAYSKATQAIYLKKTFSDENLKKTKEEVRMAWDKRQEELKNARLLSQESNLSSDYEEQKTNVEDESSKLDQPEMQPTFDSTKAKPTKKTELNKYDPSGPRIGRPSTFKPPCVTGS